MPSEKEKMIKGELYDAKDPQLCAERQRARNLCHELNHSLDKDQVLRVRIFGELFGRVGDGLCIEPPFYCDYGRNISLGNSVYFNFNCVILDAAPVTIGSHVQFAPSVQIYTATHPIDAVERRAGPEYAKSIEIGDDVWIGGGVIICPGVRIGARSVIGAGSVVTRNIPEDVVAAGNPCHIVRQLDE